MDPPSKHMMASGAPIPLRRDGSHWESEFLEDSLNPSPFIL